jgi:CheY-like chemotaxis protein
VSAARILVADDDAWILKMVSNVLERRGYRVELAADGEEAWHKALETKPDLVITDVMMPKVDGWALVRALRARPEFAFTPVIFLTALNSDEDRIKGFRLGADDYLPKPFRFEELDLRVERVIKRTLMLKEVAREQVGGAPPPSAAARPADGSGSMPAMLGSLEQIGLSGLLTMIEMERKSGVLVLWNHRDPSQATSIARLRIRSGRVLSAALDGKPEPRNAECVYHVLEWPRGRFELQAIDRQDALEDDDVGQTTTHLLMEGARRIDEKP